MFYVPKTMNGIFRRIISNQSVLNHVGKRVISTTNKLWAFYEPDDKGGYKSKEPPPRFKERMKVGFTELKKEIKLWSQEVKETWEGDPIMLYRPGEVDVAWRFVEENCFDKWIVTADSDHNEGFSTCSLTRTNYGKGLFSGTLCTRVPKDGQVKRAGYCNMKTMRHRVSFKREANYDWTPYNMLVIKVRGDGRSYLLNLSTRGYFDVTWNDVYQYVLFTRGGPYWQVAKIPFSKFYLSSKGRIQDYQDAIPLDKVSAFGISAADRYGGDFALEIDYIGLEYDPGHTERFAYEMYEVDAGIAQV